jgi:hypothetical protein
MIGIFIIATGEPYITYAKSLIKDIGKFFLTSHEKTIYLFTDSKEKIKGCVQVYKSKLGWPMATLWRFHTIVKYYDEHNLNLSYKYYIDADFKIIKPVGNEILGELAAVQHPGFYHKKVFELETKFLSQAYVNPNLVKRYYAGGFNGGLRYIEMARQIIKWIDIDQKYNFIPIYHDESYFNRYMIINPPDVILSPEYCMPETDREREVYGLLDLKPKMIAITKNLKR